ncbi:hypothetical protein SBFV3_gp45 [Sulfolobales Beppu filamentous virus 3]|uniref:Uncharacterized protein n=1 Tax=Sulfolobales Beppu filamentous virus 3 TaxID=2493124 RepID=A0A3S8NF71_9VIRU|nr:hypothetical protein HOU83_gp45 [Sulfolobales Beppu filamentous virus 3]AZI75880.1 hypothetical protein SBFV3_gp45 [Sulfolobales Beppu filamentous virus 3]
MSLLPFNPLGVTNTFTYDEFEKRYLSNVSERDRIRVFIAYINMVSSLPLSTLYTGVTYYRVRDEMIRNALAVLSDDYIFLDGRRGRARVFPVGERVVFDIYNKKPYYRRGKDYTIQVHFDLWFPYGFLPEHNIADFLFSRFYDMADAIFHRINYGASLDAMEEKQSDIDFTVGIERRERSKLANFGTVTILVTKVEATGLVSYAYSFIVRYQWVIRQRDDNEFETTLCHFYILDARSCLSLRSLFETYSATYTLYHLQPPEENRYRTLLRQCNFLWNLYTPTTTPLCNTTVNAKVFTK